MQRVLGAFGYKNEAKAQEEYRSNRNDESGLRSEQPILNLINLVFQELQEIEREHGVSIIILKDADRSGIAKAVKKKEKYLKEPSIVGRKLEEAAAETGLDFVGLQGLAERDYAVNQAPLSFPNDYHWNERMHELAAIAVKEKILASAGR